MYLSAGQLNELNIAWNNVHRRIFGMKPWESVKEIQFLCCRLDFKHLIDLSKMISYRDFVTCSLCILRCCLSRTMRSDIVKTLFYSYGVSTGCCVGFNSAFNKFKESIL